MVDIINYILFNYSGWILFIIYLGIGTAIIYALILFTKISKALRDINENLKEINSKTDNNNNQ